MAQTQSSANLKLINTAFAAMLVSMVGYFIYWGPGLYPLQPLRPVYPCYLFRRLHGV